MLRIARERWHYVGKGNFEVRAIRMVQTAQSHSFTSRKRIRKSFGKISAVTSLPNLIEVQKNSYDQFLQLDSKQDKRDERGLHGVLKSVFPIKDFAETATMEYVGYSFDRPKYDVEECRSRGINFSAALRVTMRLIVWDVDEDTGAREIKDIKEQDVYMGDIPLMTENGTFIINGTERVIVSQMHRSPGVFFDHDHGKTHSSGKFLYSARIIPYRGSWLDFEFDPKDIVHVRIDRRRKLPVTNILRALGMDTEEILNTFYATDMYKKHKKGWSIPFKPESWKGVKPTSDLVDAKSGKVVAEAGKKLTPRVLKKMAEEVESLLVTNEFLLGKYVAEDMVDTKTGEIFAEAGDELKESTIQTLDAAGVKDLPVLAIDHVNVGAFGNVLYAW
ncbi:MAG: hypothetical protein ACPG80_04660 [Rickettsiales bacterium]